MPELRYEFPEQTLQTIKNINAHNVLPIHWGKFDLANHNWKVPIESLLNAANSTDDINIATPKIGQIFNVYMPLPNDRWWIQVK